MVSPSTILACLTCDSSLNESYQLIIIIIINQSSFISYTWYMSRAHVVSIHIQKYNQKRKKEIKKNSAVMSSSPFNVRCPCVHGLDGF